VVDERDLDALSPDLVRGLGTIGRKLFESMVGDRGRLVSGESSDDPARQLSVCADGLPARDRALDAKATPCAT
jgi:hypothetical protein